MQKDKNYWLERGKSFPQKEGFVCLGRGDYNYPLKNQQKDFTNLWMDHASSFNSGWYGNSDVAVYYIEKNRFDQIFPDETPQILLNFYETQQILGLLSETELRNIFEANRHLFSYLNFAEFSLLIKNGNPYIKDCFISNFLTQVPNPLQFRA